MSDTYLIQKDIVDGFTMSASQLLLPTSYRASVIAQMDVLRRAQAMRARHYIAPLSSDEPIPEYKQVEYEVTAQPGSYVWGMSFAIFESEIDSAELIHIQISDACTETPFFSDYPRAINFMTDPGLNSTFFATGFARAPHLFAQPRLIGDPAKITIEIYNSSDSDVHCQVVLFVAEPCLPPDEMAQMMGVAN